MAPLPYWRLSGFYLFYFALLGATAPFLALYFHHLGFSSARIGELVAIPMLMRCVAPNLWGWLGDYTGKRLLIVRLGAFCTLLGFSLIFISKSYAWLALVMALHAFFWHAVLPQFEVITFAHLREQPERYSQVRLWGSIGFILTRSIDKEGNPVDVITKGRHDPCVGIRATPIAEAMMAIVLMDHLLRHRGQNADVRVSTPVLGQL